MKPAHLPGLRPAGFEEVGGMNDLASVLSPMS